MFMSWTRFRRTTVICAGIVTMLSVRPSAHDAHTVGAYRLEIGWKEEPALAGLRNAVTVEVTDAASRAPVSDLGGGSLSAEVTFGDEHLALPLRPDREHRNLLQAWLLPTRAGTYAFHITGRVKDQPIDILSTCSPRTFDCVVSSADIQFPAKDPSTGELAERLARTGPRADRALERAGSAQMLAGGALGVAILAAIVAVGLGLRRRTGG
jgi:hypothetical protein